MPKTTIRTAALLALALLFAGCGSMPAAQNDAPSEPAGHALASTAAANDDYDDDWDDDWDDGDYEDVAENDPFESWNRGVYRFNDAVDRAVLRPVAEVYVRRMPGPIRTGIGNFFRNLREPTTIVNDILQGEGRQAVNDTARFLTNTTFGLLGIFDVATHMGLPRHQTDYGITLARWGVPEGPYLVLPLLGPSTLRDTAGLVPHYAYTDPKQYIDSTATWAAVIATDAVDTRASLLGASRVLDLQLDPYLFVRESYRQNRRVRIEGADPDDAFE